MFRKRLVGPVAGLGFSMLLALAPMAHAAPDVSQFCTAYNDFGVGHGVCVSVIQTAEIQQTDSSRLFVYFCSQTFFRNFFPNQGQCVSFFNTNFK